MNLGKEKGRGGAAQQVQKKPGGQEGPLLP